MPASAIPTKTPLGVDELRHRTRRLGQRHRTVLLLVDGQRPLSEVLSLAEQAGASTRHFEELVGLGLVDLPVPVAEPEAEPDVDIPVLVDEPEVTSVELVVASDIAADEPIGEPTDEPTDEPTLEPEAPPAPRPEPPRLEEEAWERTIRLHGPAEPPPIASPSPAPLIETPADIPPARPPERRRRPRTPVNLPVLADVDEGAMLQQVRELLVDTLRLDAPLFGAITFVRVRGAQTASELIDLVWEIERHLSAARHARRELLSLQRAR